MEQIADRFKNPLDAELVDDFPWWTARVEARLKANLRPLDGVPAVQLKSWLEGAWYWDVTQNIIRLPVGGITSAGELLKEYLLYQLTVENAIDKVSDADSRIFAYHWHSSFMNNYQKLISNTLIMASTIWTCTLSRAASQMIQGREICLQMAVVKRWLDRNITKRFIKITRRRVNGKGMWRLIIQKEVLTVCKYLTLTARSLDLVTLVTSRLWIVLQTDADIEGGDHQREST